MSAAKQAFERLSVRPSLQLEEQKQEGMDGQKAGRREYEGMLRAVVADEVVHPLERLLMDQNAQRLTHGGGLHLGYTMCPQRMFRCD